MLNLIKQKTQAVALYKSTNYFLTFGIVACLALYVYFANVAVHTLTMLEKVENKVQSLNTHVSELESERLIIQNNINKTLALNLGLIEVSEKTFIVGKRAKATLSYQDR